LQANLMVRSLVDSAGIALADEIASGFALAGCTVSLGGHYPSWRPDPTSDLLATSRAVYAREYGASYGESKVQVIHAGLECGIIGSRYPGMQMVSFGPTIHAAGTCSRRFWLSWPGNCCAQCADTLATIAITSRLPQRPAALCLMSLD
jgi:dipeptidase D